MNNNNNNRNNKIILYIKNTYNEITFRFNTYTEYVYKSITIFFRFKIRAFFYYSYMGILPTYTISFLKKICAIFIKKTIYTYIYIQ